MAPSRTGKHGVGSYLDVRYSESERPYTAYPNLLTEYLTDRFLQDYQGRKLLDLGCGRGEFLHGFARCGFDVVGMDRAHTSEHRFDEPIVIGDFEADGLPFDDASLAVIFNKSVLEHTWRISELLDECHRVLEPGGRLVSMVPDWRSQWRHYFDDWTHVRPFTLTGLKECIVGHGFVLNHAQRFRQLPLLWKHPNLRLVSDIASLLPDALKSFKFVRFSKEWMLLVVADKSIE